MNPRSMYLAGAAVAVSLVAGAAVLHESDSQEAATATSLAGVAAGMHFTDEMGNARLPTAEERAALAEAGWTEREVADALAAFAETAFVPPVPRPRPVVSARDFFTYALIAISLGVAAVKRAVTEKAGAWRDAAMAAVGMYICQDEACSRTQRVERAVAGQPAGDSAPLFITGGLP